MKAQTNNFLTCRFCDGHKTAKPTRPTPNYERIHVLAVLRSAHRTLVRFLLPGRAMKKMSLFFALPPLLQVLLGTPPASAQTTPGVPTSNATPVPITSC